VLGGNIKMCFITIALAAICVCFYWLGSLDQPRFKVVEYILLLAGSSPLSSKTKQVFAIVTTAEDEDYIDNNMCTVLKATKKGTGIEKCVVGAQLSSF
jgi:hypothetical protein